jgi:hypothetical protein
MANSSRSTGPGCHSLRSTRRPWREGKRPARPATRKCTSRVIGRSAGDPSAYTRRFESATCHTTATAAQRWYSAAPLEIAWANRWRVPALDYSACWERLLARLRDAEPAVPAILAEVVSAPGPGPKLGRRNAENKTRWYLSPTWRSSGRTAAGSGTALSAESVAFGAL